MLKVSNTAITKVLHVTIIGIVLLLMLSFPVMAQHDDEEYKLLFINEEGLTVTGTIQTSQQITIIEKNLIENSGAADISVFLQDRLSLSVTRNGPYGNVTGIKLRGLEARRIAFLIDGIPANSALGGEFDINQVDINSIERIEIIYGGSDTKYNVSGAIGGVINLITVKNQKPGLKLSASISNTSALPGSYIDLKGDKQSARWEDLTDTQNIFLAAAYGDKTFSLTANVFANRAGNHFLFLDQSQLTRRKENNDIWDTGAAVSGVWELDKLTKIIASANFYYADKNIPELGFDPFDFKPLLTGNSDKQKDLFSRNTLMLDAPRAFSDNLAAEASVSWNISRRDFTSSYSDSRHDLQNLILINRWNWFLNEQIVFKSGFDYCYNHVVSTEAGTRDKHDAGIYLTAEFIPVKQFMLIPSIKAIISSEGGKTFTAVPKLGMLWNLTDSFSLKNNYFRSFKLPDFLDLYWPNDGWMKGNPNLKPEDGWGADLGADWRYKELFQLESTFFAKWIKDMIGWSVNDMFQWQVENIDEAVFFGLDNKLCFEIPLSSGAVKKIVPAISYQFLLSYVLSGTNTFASDKRSAYSPVHTLGSSVEIHWRSGYAAISGHFESLRYTDIENNVSLKPLFLLNANINHKFGKQLSGFAAVKNILNSSYETVRGYFPMQYPMPGTTFTLGIRTQFEAK